MIHRYLSYTLTLRAPILFGALNGNQNGTKTLPFIPGSALRGAMAGTFGEVGGDEAQKREFQRFVLDGTVCWLNAYPDDGGRRTMPMPISLRVAKDRDSSGDHVQTWDVAAEWPSFALAAPPGSFVSLLSAQPRYVAPRLRGQIHQQRDRAQGRAWKEEIHGREEIHGTIFAFEFLESDQSFAGVVLVRGENEANCEALAKTIQERLRGPLLLGRSRRSGYGGAATIEWGHLQGRELDGQGLVKNDLPTGRQFRAMLLSPFVIRDQTTGQIDPAAFLGQLSAALGDRARIVRHLWSFDLTGGFNRKWRIETPQAQTVAAGSVVVLEAAADIPFNDLLAIEAQGLGERRTEGFGRLAFLQEPSIVLTLRKVSKPGLTTAPIGSAPELVRLAERRILEAAISKQIAIETARLAASAKGPMPSPSLIRRLRNALRADPSIALATIRIWLDEQSAHPLKRRAMEQLRLCRVVSSGTTMRLDNWLHSLANPSDSQVLDQVMRFQVVAQRHYLISEESAHETLKAASISHRVQLIDNFLTVLARRSGRRAHDEVSN